MSVHSQPSRDIRNLPADLIVAFTRFMDPIVVNKFSQACRPFYELLRPERKKAAKEHSSRPQKYKRRKSDLLLNLEPDICPIGWNNCLTINRLYGPKDAYDGPDQGQLTQLVLAIHQGRAGVLRGYLEAGVDPNGFWGDSRLLSEAACFSDMECVKVLLEYGADPALTDRLSRMYDGQRTALARAAFMIFRPHLEYAISGPRSKCIFRGHVWNPRYDRVTRLMKAGVKITHVFELRWIRWQVNFLDILKLAVEHGTDLSKLIPEWGTTLLHVAVAYAQEDHRRRWLRPGTKIFCHDDIEIVKWIITQYPELINISDDWGETPFQWAIDVERFDIARLLFFRGFELGFAEKYSWYSEIIKGETDPGKMELLLEMREELMRYNDVYSWEWIRRLRLQSMI